MPCSKRICSVFGAFVAVLLLVGASIDAEAEIRAGTRSLAAERSGRFTQFRLGGDTPSPQDITLDSRGRIWVSLGRANAMARITMARDGRRATLEEFRIPTPNAFPQGVRVGADGSVWFAELRGGNIGRIDGTTGEMREYPLPNRQSGPVMLVLAPDGHVWFNEARGNRIGRLNPTSGEVREYEIPTPASVPLSLRRAPDGMLWFPEHEGNKLGRLDPSTGRVTEFAIPTPASGPADVAFSADGRIWFTELEAGKIGRLDPRTGRIEEFPLSRTPRGETSGPAILTQGPGGALWFTEMYGNRLGRIDVRTGRITEVPLPTAVQVRARRSDDMPDDHRPAPLRSDGPASLVFGSDGTLWYTAMFANKVGRFQPATR